MTEKKEVKEINTKAILKALDAIKDRSSKEARRLRKQLRAAGISLRKSKKSVVKESAKKEVKKVKVLKESDVEQDE